MFPFDWSQTPAKFSMLGLGDIVIPGIFVALCLKYDIDKCLREHKSLKSLKTPLFNWCFSGYILGILCTYAAMVIFDHPQPALLFLVPCCTFSILIKSLISKEFKTIFSYEETPLTQLENGTEQVKITNTKTN